MKIYYYNEMALFVSGVAGKGHPGWKAYSEGSARKTVCVWEKKPPYLCEVNEWPHRALVSSEHLPGLSAQGSSFHGPFPSCPVLLQIIPLSGHGLHLSCLAESTSGFLQRKALLGEVLT